MRLIFSLAITALALAAAPAKAATVLPLSIGGVTFSSFHDLSGSSIDAGCNDNFFALGSASCNGSVAYTGGPLGDGPHVTGSALGTGTTVAGPGGANPTATTTLNVSGGDASSGAGIAGVTTQLQYYVTVIPLGSQSTSGLQIPLIFKDAGFVQGVASSTEQIGGGANTRLRSFLGAITVDASRSSLVDSVSDSEVGGPLSLSYGGSHTVVFDFREGDTVAEVDLFASCSFGSQLQGFGSASCQASADPFFGFDQAAFDAKMGAKTFNLADAFRIELSAGLEPAGGVPEPATWALMIAGFGLAGAMLRRRVREPHPALGDPIPLATGAE